MSVLGKQHAEEQLLRRFRATQMRRILAERPNVAPAAAQTPPIVPAAEQSTWLGGPQPPLPSDGPSGGLLNPRKPVKRSPKAYRLHKHYLRQMQPPDQAPPAEALASEASAQHSRSGRAARWEKHFDAKSGAWVWYCRATGRSVPIVAREYMPSYDPQRIDDATYAQINKFQRGL